MEGVLVIKNVSVKLFSFINVGSIGDQERVCQTLQLHQWREYWWSRTCLSNSSASLLEGVLVIMNVSVKLFNFFNGGSIGDQEFVCQTLQLINGGSIGDQESVGQTLQLLQWREYWWSRKCLSNRASLLEGVLVIKNVSVKLFSFFNGGSIGDQERVCQTLQLLHGGSIGDQERVCQTLQLHQWREYWWWRTCLSNSSASSMEGVLVIKNVSVKLFSFFNGGSIGDQERVCQTLQLLQWREYWWSRTCLSNSSAFNGGSIGDQERVCQTLQLLQWREYWWSRTCLSNSSASQWREYWWSRTCLSNSSASSMEGVLVIKNVSVKLFGFFIGGSIGDHERVCQTLQLLQWREYW